MLAARIRSGLVETVHNGAVAVVSEDGALIAYSGDVDQPYFLRSAAKPFQAFVSQDQGAALSPIQLALAAASHDGEPVHVAITRTMLEEVGLDETALQCPPAWPLSDAATVRLKAEGLTDPRPIWHNCSGKHAAWLRASLNRGWPIDSYLAPDHPLQLQILETVAELGGFDPRPVGVDGCGAPVLRTTTRVMARLYARLATAPELRDVFAAMHRYPALVSGTGNDDAALAVALNAAAKRGAAGCLGVAIDGRLGVAVKAWDGAQEIAAVAMLATLEAIGELSDQAARVLADLARPRVLGGAEPVGEIQPRVTLTWT